jgi:hypothetical protein
MLAIYKQLHYKDPKTGQSPSVMASILWGVAWTTQLLDTWKKVDTNPDDDARIDRLEKMIANGQILIDQLSKLIPNPPSPPVVPSPAVTTVVVNAPPEEKK